MSEADLAAYARREAWGWQRPPAFGGHEPDPDRHDGHAVPAPAVGDEWTGDDRRIGIPSREDRTGRDPDPERLLAAPYRPTHASFFSGVGGTDIGLERAGWRTVSFSEIEPYACALLAQRWPEVPNLGDIVRLAEQRDSDGARRVGDAGETSGLGRIATATLWSGGFPCQDLSIAGNRAGLAGERSGLAFAFLDLVGRHRPPAILLENVMGLLSSHGGKDMARLLGTMADLGYGVAYRGLDGRHFGVPQRRRRVFILGLRSGGDDPDGRVAAGRAASVLAVGTRCGGHPAAGTKKGKGAARGTGTGIANAVWASDGHHGHSSPRGDGSDNLVSTYNATAAFGQWERGDIAGNLLVGETPDPCGVRASDGLAGRMDDRTWLETTHPEGLDSHRYRCCGNGVIAPVAEWIGRRLIQELCGETQKTQTAQAA